MTQFGIVFDKLERDALTELVNIGVSRGASRLRKIVGSEVLLSVPAIELVDRRTAATILQQRETGQFVAVRQSFEGALCGHASLIFPESNSLELVRAVVGGNVPDNEIAEVEDDALSETGNIVLNACLGTIANMLRRPLAMALPQITRCPGGMLFEPPDDSSQEDGVLFLYVNFMISDRNIRGYITMLMDLPSLKTLKSLIDVVCPLKSDPP